MDLKKALKQALQFEERGEGIYKNLSEESKNSIVRKTFHYLWKQEQNHIREIRELSKKLSAEGIKLKGDKKEEVKEFFNKDIKKIKESAKPTDDDIKAHETGKRLEAYAFAFYKKRAGEAEDKKVKEFFNFLAEQENAHFELIQNALEFIKNPESFYTEQEKWLVEG